MKGFQQGFHVGFNRMILVKSQKDNPYIINSGEAFGWDLGYLCGIEADEIEMGRDFTKVDSG